jgi:hypothetical protein
MALFGEKYGEVVRVLGEWSAACEGCPPPAPEPCDATGNDRAECEACWAKYAEAQARTLIPASEGERCKTCGGTREQRRSIPEISDCGIDWSHPHRCPDSFHQPKEDE